MRSYALAQQDARDATAWAEWAGRHSRFITAALSAYQDALAHENAKGCGPVRVTNYTLQIPAHLAMGLHSHPIHVRLTNAVAYPHRIQLVGNHIELERPCAVNVRFYARPSGAVRPELVQIKKDAPGWLLRALSQRIYDTSLPGELTAMLKLLGVPNPGVVETTRRSGGFGLAVGQLDRLQHGIPQAAVPHVLARLMPRLRLIAEEMIERGMFVLDGNYQR
jgi:hypothetical protein